MKCTYCGASLHTPFTARDNNGNVLCFCDILCGRLYDINEASIEPYMKEYNRAYITNRLSTSARLTLERLNDCGLFKMIPTCALKETPEATKRYYNRLFGI